MERHQGAYLTGKSVFFLICAGVLIFLSLCAGSSMKIYEWNIAFVQSKSSKEATLHSTNDQDWRKTSFSEILDLWRPKTLENCRNLCEDKEYNSSMCRAKTVEEYENLQINQQLNLLPLFSPREYVFPFEKEYLSDPPLTDSQLLPSLNLSKVVLSQAVNDVVTCQVNDVVQGLVQLVDEYGHERKLGGDEVRLWVINKNQTSLKATGQVTDLRNGSYQISFKCLWPGEMALHIAVPYPREYLRATMSQMNLGVTRPHVGHFKKGEIEEVTVCWTTPNIPDRPCVCNLTDYSQPSFYCGRPINPKLNCTDFQAKTLQTLAMPVPWKVTAAEVELIKRMTGPARRFLIRHNLKVVVQAKGVLPTLPPCYKMDPIITWKFSSRPRGYWSSKGWTSLDCQRPVMTRDWAEDCLKNTRVWVYGDSNGLRLYKIFTGFAGSKGRVRSKYFNKNAAANISITFKLLEPPLYSQDHWGYMPQNGGVAQSIDSIPSTGQQVVVIHYFIHFTPAHFSVLQDRLQTVHDAVKRLLARNPDVLVGLRGPHITTNMWNTNHAVGTDSLGTFFIDMLIDIFQDIRHKVVFLDGWGMTISLENLLAHPIGAVPKEMVRTLLSFKCKQVHNGRPNRNKPERL